MYVHSTLKRELLFSNSLFTSYDLPGDIAKYILTKDERFFCSILLDSIYEIFSVIYVARELYCLRKRLFRMFNFSQIDRLYSQLSSTFLIAEIYAIYSHALPDIFGLILLSISHGLLYSPKFDMRTDKDSCRRV